MNNIKIVKKKKKYIDLKKKNKKINEILILNGFILIVFDK